MGKVKRIQFDIDENKLKIIKKTMSKNGIKTMVDYINLALNLLQWAIKEKQSGRIIASIDESEDTYKELLLDIDIRKDKF
jgi:hypothetical protein